MEDKVRDKQIKQLKKKLFKDYLLSKEVLVRLGDCKNASRIIP